MISAYSDEEAHIPVRPTSLEDRDQRRKSRETALKAIRLLKQIAALGGPPLRGGSSARPGRAGQPRPSSTKPHLTTNPQIPTPDSTLSSTPPIP